MLILQIFSELNKARDYLAFDAAGHKNTGPGPAHSSFLLSPFSLCAVVRELSKWAGCRRRFARALFSCEKISDFTTVSLSFLFDKYCLIMN